MPATDTHPGKLPSKALERRRALLREGARQINRYGVGGLNISDVARTAGLSRNALYYYAKDKDDLARACMVDACKAMQGDLLRACNEGGPSDRVLERFIEITLVERDEPIAILRRGSLGSEEDQATLLAEETRLLQGIEETISDGMSKGILREADAGLVALLLLGMIDWCRIAPEWLGHQGKPEYRRRLAQAVATFLLDGMAARGAASLTEWPSLEKRNSMQTNPFDQDDLAQKKKEQLLGTASRLFNLNGIEGTSVNAIAAELGMTKGVLYHYFTDKDALVMQAYERAFEQFDRFIAMANERGRDGLSKALIIHHLNCQAQLGNAPPLMPQLGIHALPERVRSDFVARARKIWLDAQALVASGIEDGSCAAADIEALAEVTAGTYLPLARNALSLGGRSAHELATEICDIGAFGLRMRR